MKRCNGDNKGATSYVESSAINRAHALFYDHML